jgi:UDP-glucose 4-epimerase
MAAMFQGWDKSPRVMVTGASGHLGLRLVSALSKMGCSVFAVSRRNSFSEHANVTHILHDWREPITFDVPKVDVIFHLAAQTSSYNARKDVAGDINTNVLGTVQLLERVVKSNAQPVFIFTGSMTEYGMTSAEAADEKVPLSPQTFYDVAKLTTEMYIEQFAREGWLSQSITLRFSNIYGSISQEQRADRGFLDRSIWRALSGETLTYFGSGEYLRDFLYIEDAIDALLAAVVRAERLEIPAFNVGSSSGTTIKEALLLVAREAETLTGIPVLVKQTEFPVDSYQIEKRNSVANSTAFRESSGWEPRVVLKSGIREALKTTWGLINS